MKRLLPIAAALVAVSAGASTPLETGFDGALRGCETWLLDPASWVDGSASFEKKVGLGPMMGLVDKVNEAALPPVELRQANHFWRINATQNAGFILVVSDQLPMCHITGGGQTDIRPAVAATLGTADFAKRWTKIGEQTNNGLRSIEFRSAVETKLTMVVSQPDAKSWDLNRLQVIATAQYRLD